MGRDPLASSNKKSSKKQAAKLKRQRKQLRELGLINPKTNLRKKISNADKRNIRKFSDVLTGKATVIAAPTKKDAKRYAAKYRTKGDKVVVPRRKGEKLKWNEKLGEIVGRRKEHGKIITRELPPSGPSEIQRSKVSDHVYYTIPFMRGGGEERFTFSNWQDLENFMARDSIRNYKNWQNYVEIETLEDIKEDMEGRHIIRSRKKKKKARTKKRGK